MKLRKGLLSGIAGLATAATLALAPAAAFAAGPGGGRGGGGGGGGTGETTVTNNLSVPAVFVGPVGFGLTNSALQPPTGTPIEVKTPNVIGPGYYYLQGTSKWQAQYAQQGADTATAKWGDNLAGGSASLRAGHPIRVEMGLTSTDVTLPGYTVIKLDDNLADNVSPYGTPAVGSPENGFSATEVSMAAKVWGPGATLDITGPVTQTGIAMPGEINATGSIVFGYNWRPTTGGSYTLTFHPPVGVTVADQGSLSITANVASGGGGGGGGHSGGR